MTAADELAALRPVVHVLESLGVDRAYDRQWLDVVGVIQVQRERLDQAYLR